MITLPNGNLFRTVPSDPVTVEGYIADPTKPNLLIQQFLPCKHRENKICSVCPKSKVKNTRPACKLKGVTTRLTCVGCSKRVP